MRHRLKILSTQWAILSFFVYFFVSPNTFSQTNTKIELDKGKNTVSIKGKKFVFINALNDTITHQEYLKFFNSGLYLNTIEIVNDSIIVTSLDSTRLLRTIGTNIKELLLKTIGDSILRFKSGNPTIINFFSTRCKPCIEEIGGLNYLVKEFPNVNFIAITSDSKEVIENWVKRNKFLYHIIPSEPDINESFLIEAYPSHVFLDRHFMIKRIIVGKINFEDEELKSWLMEFNSN